MTCTGLNQSLRMCFGVAHRFILDKFKIPVMA